MAIAVLARRLGETGWAPIAVALAVSQFGALAVESGMRLYGAREVARDPMAAGRLATPIVSTQLGMGLILLAVVIAASFSGVLSRDLRWLLPGYAVSLLALPFYLPWVFQGLGRMNLVAVPQVVRFALFLVLGVALVSVPERATWLPWIEVVAMGGGAAVAAAAAHRLGVSPRPAPGRSVDKDIIREAMPIAASQLVWVARMYLPVALLWWFGTEASVSRFDLSHRILMVFQAFLTVYLANLYTPLSREAVTSRRRFLSLLGGSTALALGAGLVAALSLAAFPDVVLATLFGRAFDQPETVASLTLLGFVIPVLAVRGHAHYGLVALGRQRLEFACSLASALLLVAFLVALVPGAGAVGAARAMLGSEIVGVLLTWLALIRSVAAAGTALSPGDVR